MYVKLRPWVQVGSCLLGMCAVSCTSVSPAGSGPVALAPEQQRVATPDLGTVLLGRRSSTVRAARMEAELVRRASGEWVIVGMRSSPREAAGPSLRPPAVSGSAEAELLDTLDRYEQALESGDADRVARVWVMNPSERAQITRLMEQGEGVSVSISDPFISVNGNHAQLAFDQSFQIARRPGLGGFGRMDRALRRALGARDSVGDWGLDEVSGH